MEFKGRSLYNVLQISAEEDASVKVEPWQVLDYRQLPQEELFDLLRALDIHLDHEHFLKYAESVETPEELIEHLWHGEEESANEQQAYLILFELWRRLLPEKETLSIFFDSFDQIIAAFDAGEELPEEKTVQQIYELEDILDQAVDEGISPKEVMPFIAEYTAHDLEGFLYDYIVELLEEGLQEAASKLIDAFYPYVVDEKWFSLLHIRSVALHDEDRASALLERLLEEEEGEMNFSFMREVCSLLAYKGSAHIFLERAKEALSLAEREEELQDLLQMISAFYRCLDLEQMETQASSLLQARKTINLESSITKKDKELVEELLMAKSL